MEFPRVGVILFLIFFISKISFLAAQTCKVCQVRDFRQKSQTCICPEDYFCNSTTSQCIKCDKCFDAWNMITKTRKGEFENILRGLIEKYGNLNELQNFLNALTENVKKRESELDKIKLISVQVGKEISKIQDLLKKLQKDLKRVEKQLKKIKSLDSAMNITKYLEEIKNKMKTIQEKLKTLTFNADSVGALNINRLKIINDSLIQMNKSFPVLGDTSLNLALSLESDIDNLETILAPFSDNATISEDFLKNVNQTTNWIEKDLLELFNILNNYENVSVDVKALQKRASNVRSAANEMESKLDDLLKKDAEFAENLKNLKSEYQFYKELSELLQRFKKLVVQIEDFKKLLKILRIKQSLNNDLQRYIKERDEFKNKEKEKRQYKKKLQMLLNEIEENVAKFEKLEPKKPIDQITAEIQEMIKEIEKIREDLLSHCTSSTSSKISTSTNNNTSVSNTSNSSVP